MVPKVFKPLKFYCILVETIRVICCFQNVAGFNIFASPAASRKGDIDITFQRTKAFPRVSALAMLYAKSQTGQNQLLQNLRSE